MESIDIIDDLLAQVNQREDGTHLLTDPATPEREAAAVCRLAERLGRQLSARVLTGLELIEQGAARIAPLLLREVRYELTFSLRHINATLPAGYHAQKVEEGYLLINQAKRDAFYNEVETV